MVTVIVKPTEACNAACVYCEVSRKGYLNTRTMSPETLELLDSDPAAVIAQAVAAVVDEVRQQSGRIDLLLHAAGIEISRSLPDKPAEQFDLVVDVKADGWFNLLRAAGGDPESAGPLAEWAEQAHAEDVDGLTLHVQRLLADLLPALLQVADSQLGGHRT